MQAQEALVGTHDVELNPVKVAMEARDHSAIVRMLAHDVVVYSPVTATLLEGREAVSELLRFVLDEYEMFRCTDEFRNGDAYIMVLRGCVGGRDVDLVDVLRFDEEGKVREMRLYGRPLSSVAAFAPLFGPRLAQLRGRTRAALVKMLSGPLPSVLASGDRVLSRIGRIGRPASQMRRPRQPRHPLPER